MGHEKKYKHLFFDLDHTLWDFDTNARYALEELFEALNLSGRIDAPFQNFYENYLEHNRRLWDRYHKGHISSEELKWKRMWRTLLDFKIGDEKLAREMSTKFLDFLPVKKGVFPYTFEILDYLTARGYALHLITNGFEKVQHTKLLHSGLNKYFPHVITSERSNSMKPKKEIFEFALRLTGARVDDSIMLGDNLDADIAGAMNAGLDTVFVNHANVESPIQPTYSIRHLKELEEIF